MSIDQPKCRWCGSSVLVDGDDWCSARCQRADVVETLFNQRTKIYGEKWPRFTAEIPPELAELLEAVQRKSLGVNASAGTRASMVRAGLRMYLETLAPLPDEPINSTAEEVGDVKLINEGRRCQGCSVPLGDYHTQDCPFNRQGSKRVDHVQTQVKPV